MATQISLAPAKIALAVLSLLPPAFAQELRVRLGLSDAIFVDLNENDARAAVKAWAQSVAQPAHLEVDGGAQLMTSEALLRGVADHLVDVFSITTPEYSKVARFVDATIFVDNVSDRAGVEYVLLVRQDGGIHDLAGLHGRGLLVYQNAIMSMAPAWIETALAASGLETTDRFFSSVTKVLKVSQNVLPVYFGKADACVVTSRAFDTMSELNPQLRRQLRVIAVSPKLRVVLVGLHKDTAPEIKARLRGALLGMSSTPAGRQILTLFQSDWLIAMDASAMRASLDLLAAYDRIKARRPGASR